MKIICVGRNYALHAKELNNAIPTEPILFIKPQTAIFNLNNGHYVIPSFTQELHYEAELIIKMSKTATKVSQNEACEHYHELSVGIDFTARDLQEQQKQKKLPWEIAKAFDHSAVIGRWINKHQLTNVENPEFSMLLNEKLVQIGRPSDMIFSINHIISYASQFFTLEEGDIIFTGTPEGTGTVKSNDQYVGFLEQHKVFELAIQ